MVNNKVNSQNNKLYEFKGKVIGKHSQRVYNKRSDYYNQLFYRLQVELENKPELKEILVFQGSKVWKEIKGSEYVDKRHLFYCSPKIANYQIVSYQLVDWQELTENSKKGKNHGNN